MICDPFSFIIYIYVRTLGVEVVVADIWLAVGVVRGPLDHLISRFSSTQVISIQYGGNGPSRHHDSSGHLALARENQHLTHRRVLRLSALYHKSLCTRYQHSLWVKRKQLLN